jgi:predicted DNA-binding protein (MmcQ/YjbR family)
MEIDEIRNLCIAKPGSTESFPFGEGAVVFKTGEGKIFAILMLDAMPPVINLKCDPALALELRETYDYVQPGYHMNKKHWNTVTLSSCADERLVKDWIDLSYALVSKKKRG